MIWAGHPPRSLDGDPATAPVASSGAIVAATIEEVEVEGAIKGRQVRLMPQTSPSPHPGRQGEL